MSCEHDYENANCTNCANGLPSSAYECAKLTEGAEIMSEIHNKISELQMAIGREINNAFEEGKRVGRIDAINELYYHKSSEEHKYGDTMVCIWKSWFDKLKEQEE